MRQLCVYMIQKPDMCIIQAWIPKDRKWVEFRGWPYVRWAGCNFCMAETFRNALEGWHASVLHTGEILLLHEGHSDFEVAWKLFEEAVL